MQDKRIKLQFVVDNEIHHLRWFLFLFAFSGCSSQSLAVSRVPTSEVHCCWKRRRNERSLTCTLVYSKRIAFRLHRKNLIYLSCYKKRRQMRKKWDFVEKLGLNILYDVFIVIMGRFLMIFIWMNTDAQPFNLRPQQRVETHFIMINEQSSFRSKGWCY